MKLLDIMTGPWAIVPDKLAEIQSIYEAHVRGPKIDIKSVESALGRPLANEHQGYTVQNGTAVIPVQGVLGKGMSLLNKISGGTSTARLREDLSAALTDPNVKSIMLHIDSPGGTVDGTQELAEAILAVRGTKPIVALADGCMCSAAYWIGAAADKIFMTSDTTQIGSIGVVASHVDISKAEESYGRKTTEITAGKYKRVASQYGPLTEDGRASIQSQVDHIYSVFVEQIATFRAVSVETVLSEMADGRVFLGQQAIDAGLVDGVSTFSHLINSLFLGVLPLSAPRAGAALEPETPILEANMPITREQIQAEAPELLNTILAEGSAAELARIQSVFSASMPGHEDLIQKLAFDGKTTGGEAAMAVIEAQKAHLATLQRSLASEAPAPVVHSDPPADESEDAKEARMTIEDRCKSRWDRDASIRAEFLTLSTYTAYEKALIDGRVKTLGKKEV